MLRRRKKWSWDGDLVESDLTQLGSTWTRPIFKTPVTTSFLNVAMLSPQLERCVYAFSDFFNGSYVLNYSEWDVIYCSRPTSPGGGYRSTIGRFVFKTKEMVQVVEAPDTVKNMVSFSAFGFLDGEVSLKGIYI